MNTGSRSRQGRGAPFVLGLALVVGCGGTVRQHDYDTTAHDTDAVTRPVDGPEGDTAARLPRFASAEELLAFLDSQTTDDLRGGGGMEESIPSTASVEMADMDAPPVPEPSMAEESAPPADATAGAAGESITNVQEAGVDEGGIVKVRGEHLVVLRRGRIFTIRMGSDRLEPISAVNAFPPGTSGDGWYDEMLVHGNTIVVVGYSYSAEATEIGLFDIDDAGRVSYRATAYLRSNDYYSSRNYASRLVGDTLIFYVPHYMMGYAGEGQDRVSTALPGLAIYRSGGPVSFVPIMAPTDVYRPLQPSGANTLHTVVTCDLRSRDLQCRGQGIVGPPSRTFYVSRDAVYVWVTEGGPLSWIQGQEGSLPQGAVYRLPLGDGLPGAIGVFGSPTDQFSFREFDGHLNVLVRAEGGGDAMWSPEVSYGDVALVRVPLAAFSGDAQQVAEYTRLPRPEGYGELHNRFVADWVLYGQDGTDEQAQNAVFIHPVRGGQTTAISLPHGVNRIEALADDAVVIGSDGRNVHFTAVNLGATPVARGRYVQRDAAEGETRSHGFFFRSDRGSDGVLGLPLTREGGRWSHLQHGSAEVLFLRVQNLDFAPLGSLDASRDTGDDNCIASCTDWYGNARPIFWRGRVFALLGYELVEGEIRGDRIVALRRATMLSALR
jgi:hypothetical protein